MCCHEEKSSGWHGRRGVPDLDIAPLADPRALSRSFLRHQEYLFLNLCVLLKSNLMEACIDQYIDNELQTKTQTMPL